MVWTPVQYGTVAFAGTCNALSFDGGRASLAGAAASIDGADVVTHLSATNAAGVLHHLDPVVWAEGDCASDDEPLAYSFDAVLLTHCDHRQTLVFDRRARRSAASSISGERHAPAPFLLFWSYTPW
jgi:hypothetical protein